MATGNRHDVGKEERGPKDTHLTDYWIERGRLKHSIETLNRGGDHAAVRSKRLIIRGTMGTEEKLHINRCGVEETTDL